MTCEKQLAKTFGQNSSRGAIIFRLNEEVVKKIPLNQVLEASVSNKKNKDNNK
jgi:hypothetical protein